MYQRRNTETHFCKCDSKEWHWSDPNQSSFKPLSRTRLTLRQLLWLLWRFLVQTHSDSYQRTNTQRLHHTNPPEIPNECFSKPASNACPLHCTTSHYVQDMIMSLQQWYLQSSSASYSHKSQQLKFHQAHWALAHFLRSCDLWALLVGNPALWEFSSVRHHLPHYHDETGKAQPTLRTDVQAPKCISIEGHRIEFLEQSLRWVSG